MLKNLVNFLIISFFILAVSCVEPIKNTPIETPVVYPVETNSWTFAFYLAAENSLIDELYSDFTEIVQAYTSISNKVNIVVLYDREDRTDSEPVNTIDGTNIYHIRSNSMSYTLSRPMKIDIPLKLKVSKYNQIQSMIPDEKNKQLFTDSYELLDDTMVFKETSRNDIDTLKTILTDCGYLIPLNHDNRTNLDTADKNVLEQYIDFVQDNFISDNYMLVIGSHGSGWEFSDNRSAESINYSIIQDTNNWLNDKWMEITDFSDALRSKGIGVVFTDVCNMADIESLYELKDCADVFIGAQTTVPADGMNYTRLLQQLSTYAELTSEIIGTEIINIYKSEYETQYLSVAAFDLAKFDSYLNTVISNLSDLSTDAIKYARENVVKYVSGTIYRMADLDHLLSLLDIDVTNDSIINHYSNIENLNGTSIFFPKDTHIFTQETENLNKLRLYIDHGPIFSKLNR